MTTPTCRRRWLATVCAVAAGAGGVVAALPASTAAAASTDPAPTYVFDSFDRAVTNGLGTAPLGGPYVANPTSQPAAALGVQSGVATLTAASGATVGFSAPSVTARVQQGVLSFRVPTLPATGGGFRILFNLRQQSDGSAVVARVYVAPGAGNDTLSVCAPTCAAGNIQTVTLNSDLVAGTDYSLSSRVIGTTTTTVTARLSRSSDALALGMATGTETAVTAAGTLGVQLYATAAGNVQVSRVFASRVGTTTFAYPNADNTGPTAPAGGYTDVYPSGTERRGRLSNDMIVINGSDPTTYTNVRFHGFVDVDLPNVLFQNCVFLGGVWSRNLAANPNIGIQEKLGLLNTGDGLSSQAPGGTVVLDSEFYPEHNTDLDGEGGNLNGVHIDAAINGEHWTAVRVNIHDTLDGVKLFTEDTNLIDSWVHDNHLYPNDPAQGGGPSHSDGMQNWGVDGAVVAGNSIVNPVGTGFQTDQSQFTTKDVWWASNYAQASSPSATPSQSGWPFEINFGDKPAGATVKGFSVIDSDFGTDAKAIIYTCPLVTLMIRTSVFNNGAAYSDAANTYGPGC